MALPDAIQYGQVKWRAVSAVVDSSDIDELPDAVPVTGEVTFTPSATVLLAMGATPVTVIGTAVIYNLDSSGVLRDSQGRDLISLVATDSEGITPTGWTWSASYRLNGGAARGSFSFELPAGTVVDLTTVAPVAASNGAAIIQGPEGPEGPPGPEGGTPITVDGAPVGALDIDSTALTPADIGAQPAGSYVTSSSINSIVSLTQTQYDALGTKPTTTLYIITGA